MPVLKLAAALLAAGASVTCLADTKVLATRKQLTAYLIDCGPTTTIHVESPDGSLFADQYGDFGTVLRSLKFIVPQACEGVEKVVVKGMAGDAVWYMGATTVADGWEFKGLYAPL